MKRRFLTLSIVFGLEMFMVQGSGSMAQERGFVHPGGLHTEADFARVKAQLAAGNSKVKQAFAKLTSAAYAQSNVQTSPTETIVRGGSGENYMNAARGAAMAYQNALRWKIEGKKGNADAAVRILMSWARTTKAISGDSNQYLASGIYGYAFAQAAELMRDYDGWSGDDQEEFKRWMLNVWYPKCIEFLRRRNGSWENSGKWWQAPGHYWSNWSLANVLTVMSIGVLCDDVFIYNQGASFFKYDQVGTYADPPTLHEVTGHDGHNGELAIWNDGLTDFLGNCVVTCVESELESGAYGCLGQMNESGRDGGHCALALGLALDVAKVGWNQGDDLFAYMDHRLAAGVEYVAAQTQGVEGLPWVNYLYYTNGFAYTDGRSQLLTSPALPAQMRPYWGTVIGIYEGVKGVNMPFSEAAYSAMGIDEGAQGSTSGGYDHMGFSVLMNTREPQLCPAEQVPTELMPLMEYSGTLNTNLIPSLTNEKARGLVSGKTIYHNELGGLVNSYKVNNRTCLPAGETLRLVPQLPQGEEDTGIWLWNTGERTRDITVTTDSSYIYRVTYTNSRGVESHLAFAIAVAGDCRPDELTPTISVGNDVTQGTTARVLYGKTATLGAMSVAGYGTWKWTGNKTTQTITTSALRTSTDYNLDYTNQGGAVTSLTFHLDVVAALPYAMVGDKTLPLVEEEATMVGDKFLALTSAVSVGAGDEVKLGLTLPSSVGAAHVSWDDGSTGSTLIVPAIQESHTYEATFTLAGEEVCMRFNVFVKPDGATMIESGKYLLRHVGTDTYLTAQSKNQPATFEPLRDDDAAQQWLLERSTTPRYALTSLAASDSLQLSAQGKMVASAYFPFYIDQAVGTTRLAIHTSTSSTAPKYLDVSDGILGVTADKSIVHYPFELIAVDDEDGVSQPESECKQQAAVGVMYDLGGREIAGIKHRAIPHGLHLQKGIYVVNGNKIIVK